jgi:CheY-like chemotaxis protein
VVERYYRGLVFIAEDDDGVRQPMEELCELAGYLVLTARDGEEALHRMRGISSEAVAVLDLNMPRMDGHQLIAAMKADEKLSHIHIIVVTGHSSHADIPDADRVLRKPVSANDLLRAISELLKGD